MTRDFGDVAVARVAGRVVCVLGHPDVVHQVFVRQARRLAKAHGYRRLAFMLGQGLLTSNGELHASQRRRLLPSLSPDRVRTFDRRTAAVAEAATRNWAPGRPRDVHLDMAGIALRVLTETLLRSGAGQDVPPAPRAVRLGTRLLDVWGELPGFALLMRLPLPPVLAFLSLRRRLDAWARQALARPEPGGTDAPQGVAHLLAARDPVSPERPMDPELARDELVTLLLAGHETTASALAFAFHLLSQEPTWERRTIEEVDQVLAGRRPGAVDLPRLDLCRRVLLESLRLYPPIFGLSRLAIDDLEAGGWRIPRGSMVCASIYALGRDPRFWEDPERFDPDRWLPGRLGRLARDAFLPFGLADRRCIGEPLFWIEAPIVLATILGRWRLRARSARTLPLQAAVTLRPARGLWMVPVARTPSSRIPT